MSQLQQQNLFGHCIEFVRLGKAMNTSFGMSKKINSHTAPAANRTLSESFQGSVVYWKLNYVPSVNQPWFAEKSTM